MNTDGSAASAAARDPFHLEMRNFVEDSKPTATTLIEDAKGLEAEVSRLLASFGEKVVPGGTMAQTGEDSVESFFGLLAAFRIDFERAVAANARRRAQQEEARKRKEAAARREAERQRRATARRERLDAEALAAGAQALDDLEAAGPEGGNDLLGKFSAMQGSDATSICNALKARMVMNRRRIEAEESEDDDDDDGWEEDLNDRV